MKLNKDQRGVAFIAELLVFLVITSLVGYIGWRIMQSRGVKTGGSDVTLQQGNQKTKAAKSWQEAGYAVKGKFADADIVQISENKWRLYYSIQPEVQGNNFEVYSSVSSDGQSWTKESGTRKAMATFPNVVKTSGGKYRMYYQNAGVIKSATGSDGLNFTDDPGTRVDTSNSQGLTLDNVAAPTVYLMDDDTYLMVYRGTINKRYAADTPNSVTQLLFWATSKDGLNFTKKGVAIDTRNGTLRGQLDGPSIVKWDDGKLHIFSTTYAGVYEFIFENNKFSTGSLAFTLGANSGEAAPPAGVPQTVAPPPGDPTLAKIDGIWHMYYGATGEKSGIHYGLYK